MICLVSFCSANSGDGVKAVADCDGEKCSFVISAEDFLSLGLVKGEISAKTLGKIKKAEENYSAYRAALRMLSFGGCSAKALYLKLRKRSFSHNASEYAAKKVACGGYIDEEKQIENYLRQLVTKKFYGRRKILPYLLARGYSGDKIIALLDENYSESDFSRAKVQFLEKKFGTSVPKTPAEAAEMKKELYKRGY